MFYKNTTYNVTVMKLQGFKYKHEVLKSFILNTKTAKHENSILFATLHSHAI